LAKEIRRRKCLVTKEVYPSSELVRFVCGPDGTIVPDVAAKLPGRGCWVYAGRQILEKAVKEKIFLRFGHQVLSGKQKKTNDLEELEKVDDKKIRNKTVMVADDLPDLVEKLLLKRCLEFIGLANRAGNVISGFEKVRATLKSGKTKVLLTACDAAENGRSKMCQGLQDLTIVDIFTREDLSRSNGLDNAVHLALLPGGISKSLLREISRYERCRKTVIN